MSYEQAQDTDISGSERALGVLLTEHKNGYARKLYKQQSDAHKAAELCKDVRTKTSFLYESGKRKPVNFNDIEDVQNRAREYLNACADTGSFPSMMGLSAYGFGVSRQAVYAYLKLHPETESSRFIDRVRDLIADVLSSAALNRNADNATAIFVLKNGLGFSDRVEIEPVIPQKEESDISIEDIKRRYMIDE